MIDLLSKIVLIRMLVIAILQTAIYFSKFKAIQITV